MTAAPPDWSALTPREHEVLRRLADGAIVKRIGRRSTVYHIVGRIREKTGVRGPLYRIVILYSRTYLQPPDGVA